jgi:hypothetical protein
MKEEIIVFGDVHFAKIWDDIDKILGNKLDMLNPNKELRKIVKTVNNSSNVIAAINNGDSVDYFFTDYFGNKITGDRQSNWDLFNQIIGQIEKPYFEIPGNHDYRRLPYNFNFWGLKHLNISDKARKKFGDVIGHNKFRWLNEISSLSVNEKKFDPLKKFNGFKKPVEKDFGHLHCVFLNTGSDAFVRMKNFLRYFRKIARGKNLQKIVWRRDWRGAFSCDNDGFKIDDFKFIEKILGKNGKDLYFFMHTPIINPKRSHVGREYKLNLKNLLKSIIKNDIAHEVVLNGGGKLLEKLVSVNYHKKNFVIIASHIHNAKYFLIHKDSLVAKEVTIDDLNREKDNPIFIKHLTTLSLGAIDHYVKDRKVGYLKITKDGFEEVVTHRF